MLGDFKMTVSHKKADNFDNMTGPHHEIPCMYLHLKAFKYLGKYTYLTLPVHLFTALPNLNSGEFLQYTPEMSRDLHYPPGK